MELKQLLKNVDFRLVAGDLDRDITGVFYDSRQVIPGALFICISGFKTDGHLYINQAIDKGAIAVMVEKEVSLPEGIACLLAKNTRMELPILAANFYAEPSKDLRLIGVTGTNGKTTTTHLIKAILEENHKKVGIMGTLYARIDDTKKELGHTTPEAPEIEEFISLSRKKSAEYIVMEVSSHALALNRVDKIHFNVAIFTNLTQDHLDLHENMENYKEAKARLFSMLPDETGNFSIINVDDPYAKYFINAAGNHYTYGIKQQADVQASDLNISLKGSQFRVNYNNDSFNISMELIGLFSVYNALAAIAFALEEGISPEVIKSALEKVEGVPGRFEEVKGEHDFTVIVDYAHTPDGLENILRTGRQITENRLITVFGCGGDRDRTKRPLMGEMAAQYSDFSIVTSDNPRSEEPERIIADIIPGMDKIENSRYAIIVDRREAIRHAIYLAKKGDLVIIAGKGHETYQLVKDKVLHFDDREVAREFLKGKINDAGRY
ncbi:MAG: UDP-N-acetylmuramoyl-L-alanyl-D-glutamate--2,6-diaminopimelate ligase [Syntrophomonadaceae bacterium]|nr:UDP-N-acetylmuramoyl-L-alanyl-D-glutamate--2,6-diaminopimelate ligase [Syntrophomonadaceae bacterium]MDD3888767.1 UDP-N-acetylmuramoyl-L-alanyl-D-glutamate--2,6-diaminopimelate ligase [Syntrophomonadaceae bacterium]MDD4548192.1 UDP-N-acetylmuramoyl-L-alanyl-D-glutamate--2,6-diaminopimelate ligase [Syntrophomonadaceae bacterium]